MRTFIALILVSATFGSPIDEPLPVLRDGIGGRIVGGQEADEGEYPWQISWRRSSGSNSGHSCGGSILNENWVLSAGHCCAGIGDVGEIVAGTNNRFDDEDVDGVQIRSYVSTLHPDYNAGNTNNDVCLLKLNEPLNLTANGVRAIELNRFDDWSGGEPFTVSGWGTLQSGGGSLPERLQEVTVPFVGHFYCQVEYFPYSITDGMICAGESGKDSCQGDSGGPLVHFDENGKASLVGVVSWGIGCGTWLKPGVYAKVAQYADWIESTMAEDYY